MTPSLTPDDKDMSGDVTMILDSLNLNNGWNEKDDSNEKEVIKPPYDL